MFLAIFLRLGGDSLVGIDSGNRKLVRDDPRARFEFLELRTEPLQQWRRQKHGDHVCADNIFRREPNLVFILPDERWLRAADSPLEISPAYLSALAVLAENLRRRVTAREA